MKHLRDLRSPYDSALAAKRAYYALFSSHLQDHIHIAHTNRGLQEHNLIVIETYYTAKHTTQTLNSESAAAVGLTRQCSAHVLRLQTLTNTRQHYTQQLVHHAQGWAYR